MQLLIVLIVAVDGNTEVSCIQSHKQHHSLLERLLFINVAMAATTSLRVDANHPFHVNRCWTGSTQCSALIQLDCNPAKHPPLSP